MSNTLTNLAPDLYKAADIVGRELVGFIPSVTLNAGIQETAQGDVVRAHFTQPATVQTGVTPSMTIPEGDDQTVDNKSVTLDQIARVSIPWEGEEQAHVNLGIGFSTIYGDQILQAMRGIANTIEAHVAQVAYQGASRAHGTAGTTPFASNFNELPQLRKILADNGAPVADGQMSVIMDTTAGANMRSLAQLQKANEAGGDGLLRQGTLLDLQGFMLRESAQVQSHTKGTATGLDANGAQVVDATSIVLDGGDGGTVVTGDVVTFAGDTNKYVVGTGIAAVSGTIVLNPTGLEEALADTTEMTIGNDFTANVALHRAAVELAMRPLAKPAGGDAAVDEMIIQDPHSGLVFRISDYRGYNKAMFDITVLYKAKAWKEDFIALLLG